MGKCEGKIGPFFYLDGEVVADTVSHVEGSAYGDFKDWGSHDDFWKLICIVYIDNSENEYFSIPRGRVTYNTKTHVYHIYLNPDLNNDRIINMILEKYCLNDLRYKIDDTDLHYKIYSPSQFDDLINNEEE